MRTIKLAGAHIDLHDDDGATTVTRYPDFGEVPAQPEDTEMYRATAQSLGYGTDTARMSREHELTHSLLAEWLGLERSPTLYGLAIGSHDKHYIEEESAVLAIQAFARAKGVDLQAVAIRLVTRRQCHRSAITGRFITRAEAEASPDTTVQENG